MKTCGKLWLKYYAAHEDVMPKPDWLVKWLETHDIEEISALNYSSEEELCVLDAENGSDWHSLFTLHSAETAEFCCTDDEDDHDDSEFLECSGEVIASTQPVAPFTRSQAVVVPKLQSPPAAVKSEQCDEKPTSVVSGPPLLGNTGSGPAKTSYKNSYNVPNSLVTDQELIIPYA